MTASETGELEIGMILTNRIGTNTAVDLVASIQFQEVKSMRTGVLFLY